MCSNAFILSFSFLYIDNGSLVCAETIEIKNKQIKKITNILSNNNHEDFLKYYKLFAHFDDNLIDFKKIEVETLVCTAKGDVGSTAEMSSNLGNTISNSKVVIFEQGKHMVGIECAEEVNKVFKNFIEGSR